MAEEVLGVPILWRWALGSVDPVKISETPEEVTALMMEKGYGVRPEWGKALYLTDEQLEQLRRDLCNGGASH
jgi:hypothetical protein